MHGACPAGYITSRRESCPSKYLVSATTVAKDTHLHMHGCIVAQLPGACQVFCHVVGVQHQRVHGLELIHGPIDEEPILHVHRFNQSSISSPSLMCYTQLETNFHYSHKAGLFARIVQQTIKYSDLLVGPSLRRVPVYQIHKSMLKSSCVTWQRSLTGTR